MAVSELKRWLEMIRLAFGLIVVTLPLIGAEQRSTVRDEISRVLKETFVYDESIGHKQNADGEPYSDEEVVSLPAVVVSAERRDVVRIVAENRKKKEDEAFDWRNGGTILKKKGKKMTSELMFSDNPNGGIGFLSFSW